LNIFYFEKKIQYTIRFINLFPLLFLFYQNLSTTTTVINSIYNIYKFGQIISRNCSINNKLSDTIYTTIFTAIYCSKSKSEIVCIFNILYKTVFNTIQYFNQINTIQFRFQDNRSRKYTDRIKKYIHLFICYNLCLNWIVLLSQISDNFSKLTIYKILYIYKFKK